MTSTCSCSTVRRPRPVAWVSPGNCATRSPIRRRSWWSSPGRRIAGWPPTRRSTPPWCTRSTRSPPGVPSPACCANTPARNPFLEATVGDRTWPHLVNALLHGEDLSTEDTAWAMAEVMAGSATPVQIAAFVVALRAKGETAAEIGGLVSSMLAHAVRVELPEALRADAVDVVGTGGDRAHTVNISTMAAIVVAGAGIPVVKHGNRAATSACGAADLLEFLGLPLDLSAAGVARCVHEVGIGFCFAASFHP